MLAILLVGAAEAEPKLDEEVQVFVEHLGARTTGCPGELPASDIADRTYCATIDLDLEHLRKSVRKFIRRNVNAHAVQLAKWSTLDGGLHATPLLVGSIVLQVVFDPHTAMLLLIPHSGCMGASGVTAPGLFEWASDGLELPERIVHARPEYPERARAARVGGVVVLQAIVQKDGTIGEHCVLHAQPTGYGFVETAIRALEQARYKPATRDEEPIEVVVTVATSFAIN